MEQEQQVSTGFIVTAPAKAEKPPTLKHRGSLTSLRAITSNKGTRGIEVNVVSESNGREYKKTIWPPVQWTSNVFITAEELQKFPVAEGKKQTPYERYGRTIASTDGRGELQQILKAGEKTGRELVPQYTDFDTLVEQVNSQLAGIPIIFTTGSDGEPSEEFGFKIGVKSIRPFDANFEKLSGIDAGGGE